MFRPSNNKDITDEEFKKFVAPHIDKLRDYILTYIPDTCAYYIATGYQSDAIWEEPLTSHIGTVLEMYNYNYEITTELTNKVIEILETKYGYEITSINPLNFK